MTANSVPKTWHVSSWSTLAWLETGVKLIGLVAAILALIQALSGGTFTAPTGGRLIQVILLSLLAFGLFVAIGDRYLERETIAMIFVLINNVGHWGMVYALLTLPGPGTLLIIFAALMMIGDLIKIRWITTNQISMRGYPPSVLVGLTGFFVFGYLMILVLALIGV